MNRYLPIVLLSLGTATLTGQQLELTSHVIPDTPPSPQAQAFTRMGEFTIENSTGTPDISIPLFNIEYHGYQIPLNLRYMANPIKPGYNYDVFGLGWTLSGNSCVSRTIRGCPDEDRDFMLDTEYLEDNEYIYRDNEFHAIFNQLNNFNFQYDRYNLV